MIYPDETQTQWTFSWIITLLERDYNRLTWTMIVDYCGSIGILSQICVFGMVACHTSAYSVYKVHTWIRISFDFQYVGYKLIVKIVKLALSTCTFNHVLGVDTAGNIVKPI